MGRLTPGMHAMEAGGAASLQATPAVCPSLFAGTRLISLRLFHKQIKCRNLSLRSPPKFEWKFRPTGAPSNCIRSVVSHSGNEFCSQSVFSSLFNPNARILGLRPLRSMKCSYSNSMPSPAEPELKTLGGVSLESLKSSLLLLTPIDVCKWVLVFAVSTAAFKWFLSWLFNPFFWMYFSWSWLFWPWIVAIALAVLGFWSLSKYLKGEASLLDQLAMITSAFTWLTLVPPAHFNGFLEGWPFVFFFIYHYFFFLNVSVRKRMYGDYYPREHDSKWDVSVPDWQKLLFCIGVMVGHWLAAFEGQELHLIPGGWNNVAIWILIMLAVFMQYHSTLYLAKYSEKIVVPTAVVQFGPYRFVRHPIYASTMLLFVTYFTALRAPLSILFIVAICLMYYGQKLKLEESLMLETFGERYTEYMNKVQYKLIPLVY